MTQTTASLLSSSAPSSSSAIPNSVSTITPTTTPPTVAIIGCGPGGMFFCHALETRRQTILQSDGPNSPLLSCLPVVTCFERGASPGGVWRAKRQHHDDDPTTNDKPSPERVKEDITNMYEALWTNGPKESIEFFDYTFDDHFGRRLPVHIPRQAVLDYMTARVTRNCPEFFDQYAQFHTSVESVTYSQEHAKFHVTTRHVETGTVQSHAFDKCIWAAGDNGKPKMPKDLVQMLEQGGFQGRILHSSDAHHLKENVQGKRVLMIGGGYSAEDLALMAIKLGAAKVLITSRSDDPVVAWAGAWPMDKVKVYNQRVPVSVEDGGRSIQLAGVDYTWPNQYKTRSKKAEKLRDIDTIIFCTGYEQNMEMMDDSLKAPFTSGYNDRFTAFPEGWKMKDNVLSEVTGHVKPGDVRYRLGCVVPGLYRGVLINNPSMMYLLSEFSEFPLLAADVNAWMLFGFLAGTTPLPTPDEMTKLNDEQALVELNMPWLRYWMDRNYRKKLNYVDDFWAEGDGDDDDARWYEGQAQYDVYEMQRLAQFMKEANYPLCLIHEDGTLNDKGEALYKFNNASYYLRANLVEDKEQGWRTFRDCENAHEFYSIHTGTKAIPLKSRWLDLDDHDPNLV